MINKITFFLSFMVLLSLGAKAQEAVLNGVVHDEQNLPMPGVNVVLAGTSVGTVTDMDGNFSVTVPAEPST